MRIQEMLGTVKLGRELLRKVAEPSAALSVDHHRGELTIARAARALEAFELRSRFISDDVRRAAKDVAAPSPAKGSA